MLYDVSVCTNSNIYKPVDKITEDYVWSVFIYGKELWNLGALEETRNSKLSVDYDFRIVETRKIRSTQQK